MRRQATMHVFKPNVSTLQIKDGSNSAIYGAITYIPDMIDTYREYEVTYTADPKGPFVLRHSRYLARYDKPNHSFSVCWMTPLKWPHGIRLRRTVTIIDRKDATGEVI